MWKMIAFSNVESPLIASGFLNHGVLVFSWPKKTSMIVPADETSILIGNVIGNVSEMLFPFGFLISMGDLQEAIHWRYLAYIYIHIHTYIYIYKDPEIPIDYIPMINHY